MFLVGERTYVPLTWLCKKQSAVYHSSTESEVVAFDTALRVEGIPADSAGLSPGSLWAHYIISVVYYELISYLNSSCIKYSNKTLNRC